MARPRNDERPAVVWNVKLLLYDGQDDDLIRLYHNHVAGTRNGADVVKAAMRSGGLIREGESTEDDEGVLAALDSLVL